MRLTILSTIIGVILFLTACGESHSYSGVLKMQNGPEKTEGKVTVTIKKQSEKAVSITISNNDSNNPTLLYKCSSLDFIKQESGDKAVWMAMESPCTLFKDNDAKFTGMLDFDDKKVRFSGNLNEGSRAYFHEFEGTAK